MHLGVEAWIVAVALEDKFVEASELAHEPFDRVDGLANLMLGILGRVGHSDGKLLEIVGYVRGPLDHRLAGDGGLGRLGPRGETLEQIVEALREAGVARDIEEGLEGVQALDFLLRLAEEGRL